MHRFSGIPLFSQLDENELAVLERHLAPRRYRRNTVLIERGDETSSLYFILEGAVVVYVTDERTGKEIILNTQGPGEYFGELAILLDSPRTASVKTTEDSTFLVITKHQFKAFLLEHPAVAYTLVRTLAQRVVDLTDEMSSLALDSVYARVRNFLVTEAAGSGEREAATPRITQQHIASRIGASREMVSRILKDLKEGGYISLEHKRVIIHKPLPEDW